MTMQPPRRMLLARLAVPALLAVLAGCATTTGAPSSGGNAELLQRAQTYWSLVQTNDRVAAWTFEAASKDQSMALEGYLKRSGLTYDSVEVRGVRSQEGDRAVVDVWMRYGVPQLRLKGQETVAQDDWRRIDGVWHHVLRSSAMFPGAKQ